MTFLQPLLLAALPLAALPIIIHLINQYRYQSVRWGAMMFLLAAQQMSRGYTKLRQWLILLFRVLAIAGLILAISRPLSSGWLGLAAGGRADTTLLVVDRSPSMQQQAIASGISKIDTGQRQLVDTLRTLGTSRWVLFDQSSEAPLELDDLDYLIDAPESAGRSSTTDIPGLLLNARQYIETNQVGRVDIWLCSDLRENDWQADGGRWEVLRETFGELGARVRFHLLAYPQIAPDNLSVRVTQVRVEQTGETAELLISVRLQRQADAADEAAFDAPISTPIEFDVEGVRSVHNVEWSGTRYDLQDHRIPLAPGQQRGWGQVSIPADENPSDNVYYFVFGPPTPRKTILVAENPRAARPLELAAAIPSDSAMEHAVEIMTAEQLLTAPWEEVALLLWQGEFPTGETARQIEDFVGEGGRVLFFPPRAGASGEFLGVSWQEAESAGDEAVPVATWRGDQDLLANTLSGTALPVGQIQVRRHVQLAGEFTPLAALERNQPLLVRAITDRGGAYFLASTPAPADTSLARDGVVLYVLVQRALAAGAERLGDTRHWIAGAREDVDTTGWQQLAGTSEALSTSYAHHAGVYADGDQLVAINREEAEDQARLLDDARVEALFEGLDIRRIEDQAGSLQSLIQEVWRLFLVSMLVALIVEAGLSLPKPRTSPGKIS
jgi:hypothetical protein